jgi:hypothetical protein
MIRPVLKTITRLVEPLLRKTICEYRRVVGNDEVDSAAILYKPSLETFQAILSLKTRIKRLVHVKSQRHFRCVRHILKHLFGRLGEALRPSRSVVPANGQRT